MDKTKIKNIFKRAGAAVLCGGILVGGALAFCYGNGYLGGKGVETEKLADEIGTVVVNNGKSNGITLTGKAVQVTGEEYESYYEVTATVDNENATDTSITWSLDWASETDAILSDYLVLSSDTSESGDSIYIYCYDAFSTQATLTATADGGNNVTATADIDYLARLNSDAGYNALMVEEFEDGETAEYYFYDGDGLIYFDLVIGSDVDFTYFTHSIYNENVLAGTLFDTYTVTDIELAASSYLLALDDGTAESLFTVTDGDFRAYSCETGASYVNNAIACMLNLNSLSELTSSQYYALQDLVDTDLPLCTATVYLEGDTYGLTYYFTCEVTVNFEDYYVAASSLTLNETSIMF